MAQEPLYKPGQLVWAKMKGYPYWPAKVIDESDLRDKKPIKMKGALVHFFGGDTYASIPLEEVAPYFRFRSKYAQASKRRDFLGAVADAEKYIAANPEVSNFESDEDGNLDEMASTILKIEPNIGRNSPHLGNVSMTPPTSVPKRGKGEKQFNARAGKRSALPPNGPDGPSESKKYATSSLSVRMKPDFHHKKIGFIGLGGIGSRMVRRLLEQGFRITIHDRSLSEKINKDLKEFANVPSAASPAALMEMCDIVFNCVTDLDMSRDVFYGNNGIMEAVGPGKAYVEMTTIDPQSAIEIFGDVTAHGGRFLEAPLSGLKKDAEDGRLVFLCAGDKTLFDECSACFQAIGRRAVFFGDAGNGAKFRLLHQMLAGIMISGVAEIAALAYRCGLSIYDLSDVIGDFSPMGCVLVKKALKDILDGVFEPSQQLGQLQKELHLALNFSSYDLAQPASVTAAAHQVFLFARRGGEESSDAAAVYRVLSDSTKGGECAGSSSAMSDDTN